MSVQNSSSEANTPLVTGVRDVSGFWSEAELKELEVDCFDTFGGDGTVSTTLEAWGSSLPHTVMSYTNAHILIHSGFSQW